VDYRIEAEVDFSVPELEPGDDPVAVRIDPEQRYPDTDRSNDTWTAGS